MKKFGLIALLALAGCAAPATESQTTAEQPSSNETASANSRTLSGIVEEPVVIDSEGDVTVTLEDADVDSITIQNAKSATIVLKSDSIVRSATGGSSSEEDAKAAIYADCPLVLKGEGSLAIEGAADHGMFSKDTITIESGTYAISCANDGIKGKDGVTVQDGAINVESGDHTIASTKNKDGELGSISIEGGTLTLNAQGDGLHATGPVVVNGGTLTIDSAQEGIEGQTVSIHGGNTTITAADDGINASGPDGKDTGGMDPFSQSSSDCLIEITGGQTSVTANGDGLDSNGSLRVSGGTTFVYGPESGGDFALDFDQEGSFTGGTLVTTGYAGMVETLNSEFPSLMAGLPQSAGSNVQIEQNGKSLLSFTPTHAFEVLLVYDGQFQTGDSLSVLGESVTLSQGVNTIGNVQEGPGPQGGFGNPQPPRR